MNKDLKELLEVIRSGNLKDGFFKMSGLVGGLIGRLEAAEKRIEDLARENAMLRDIVSGTERR